MTVAADGRFSATVVLDDLLAALDVADRQAHVEESDEGVPWNLALRSRDKRSQRLTLADGAGPNVWALGEREVVLHRTYYGNLSLIERSHRPVVTSAQWRPDGRLDLSGTFLASQPDWTFLVRASRRAEEHAGSFQHDVAAGRFVASINPAAVADLANTRVRGSTAWTSVCSAPAVSRSPPWVWAA